MEAPTCQYKRRLRKEEIAVPVAAIIVVITVGILMTPLEYLEDDCASITCKNESERIYRKINPEISPCDDFHQFACGKNYLRKELNEQVPVDELIKQTERDILELYKEPIRQEDHTIIKAMKALFKVCKSGEFRNDSVSALFSDILESSEEQFDWIAMTYKLRNIGLPYNIILDVIVDDDPKNRSKGILKVKIPSKILNNNGEDDDTLMLIDRITAGRFRSDSTINLANEMEEIYKFSDILKKQKKENVSLYLPHTISDIQKDIPSINWLEFLEKIVSPSIDINSANYLILAELHSLKDWLDTVANTPKRTQAYYMLWIILQELAPFLPSDLRNHFLSREELEEDEEELCYKALQKRFIPNPLSIIYAKKQLNENKIKGIQDVLKSIKEALLERLNRNRRFSKDDKDNIKEKLLNMKVIIGEPQSYLEDTFLDELLTDDQIVPNNNSLHLFGGLNRNYINYLYCTIDKSKLERHFTKWYMKPTWHHMFYDIRNNVLRIPTTQVQDIAFDEEMPGYVKFGMLGKKIGEQLSMLLRFSASLYDKDGNVTNGWDPKTIMAIHKSRLCFESDMEVFNSSTLSYLSNEYQAQSVAAKLSYDAYKKWVKTNNKDITLATYYTKKQLFWIWTAVCHQENYSYLITRNPSLTLYYPNDDLLDFPRLATYAIARNNNEFRKDFKCLSQTLMASSKRCQVI